MPAASANLTQTAALARGVTALSVATAGILVTLKAVIWWVSGSVALMASMADSGLDLIASLATFVAVRYAAAPPDAEHRYGHGKAEAFAGLIQAGLVFASAALIAQEAVHHIIHPEPVAREGWAIAVMLVSTVFTIGLIAAQTRLLRRADSVAIAADRTHYAADLASNLIALAGIGAVAAFGWVSLDAVAGLLIAGLLLWGAIVVFRQASNQLLDHELPEEARSRIAELVMRDSRLTNVHQLRTRASGRFVHIQMHADLDPDLSLEAAYQAVMAAEARILEAFPAADIIIHPDPRGRAQSHGRAGPHDGGFAEFVADEEPPAERP